MKAEVTLSNLYWNKNLANFFFRDQAYRTFEELIQYIVNSDDIYGGTQDQKIDSLEFDVYQYYSGDLDNFEEDCYNLSVEEILNQFYY